MSTAEHPDFTGFVSGLPWADDDWLWQGKTGLRPLDEGRNVTAQLSTRGHGDQYEGFMVKVVSKTHGEIATKFFPFMDHMSKADDVSGHRNADHEQSFHVWRKGDWYILRPSPAAQLRYTGAIEAWVSGWL